MAKLKCNYCNQQARFVDGSVIYPHLPELHHKRFYLCEKCDVYCGCHPNSTRALGTLADKSLRVLRKNAHYHLLLCEE